MNVIISYLDTMFSTYPQTPRLREAKAELQGMMEDAYTSLIAAGHTENEAVGQVIRDFGNLDEVAPVLGITADVTSPSDSAPEPGSGSGSDNPAPAIARYPAVTLDEAQGYSVAQKRIRSRVTTAVILFVLSPAALISLSVAAETGVLALTEGAGTFIGLLVLFALVAIGVSLVLATTRETAPFKRISEGNFSTNPVVTRWADDQAEQHERGRIRALQISVALWILAPVPLIAFSLLLEDSPQSDFWSVLGVVIVLALVATGLGVLLPHTWASSVAETLSHGSRGKGNNGSDPDDERSIVGVIAAFYWPLLTAIFLAWSFIGNAWGISWILWPVGAVLFGAIAAGSDAVEKYRTARR
jgi:MFS family permease